MDPNHGKKKAGRYGAASVYIAVPTLMAAAAQRIETTVLIGNL